MNKPVNLNMLFVDMLPNYRVIIDNMPENKPMSKEDFIKVFKASFNTMEPRTNLFLHGIEQSEFETIKRQGSAAIFNE